MPGIFGIISSQPPASLEMDLDQMASAMKHQQHYRTGRYTNPELGLYLGWVSHDGSFDDCMPLISRQRDAVLIFLGEHFDARSNGSSERSGAFDSARRLLSLFDEHGEELLPMLNGWFCGLLVDLRARKTTLFTDRFGMGRVYYHQSPEEFLFASEAKCLLRVRPKLRTFDPMGLAQHLRFNCVLGGRTLFNDVSLLPPAAAWQFQNSVAPRKEAFFSFKTWEELPPLPPREVTTQFYDRITELVPAYTKARQQVGVSLTAGLDTRVIMAASSGNGSLPCYTFGGSWGETFDISTARRVSNLCGFPFKDIRLAEQFFENFAKFAPQSVYLSDGMHDAFGAHDVYFNQVARSIAPVRLTGKFGSEVVRTRKLVPTLQYPDEFLTPELRHFLQGLGRPDANTRCEHPLTRVLCEEIPWYEYGRVAVEQAFVTLRTPYMDNALVRLMYQIPQSARAAGNLQADYVAQRSPKLASILTNFGSLGNTGHFASRVLRLPFWALFKIEYIYLYATPHWMTALDTSIQALKPERLFAGRQKFEGYRLWIRRHFADFIQQTLLSTSASYPRYFDRKFVERIVAQHLRGTHNHLNELNKVLTLELTCSTLGVR